MVSPVPRRIMASSTPTKLANFLWDPQGPGGHACQVYANDAELIDTLTGYAGGALWNGDAVVVVATQAHAQALESRLRESGLDLGFLRSSNRYVSISAEALLARICVDGTPDEDAFGDAVGEALRRAGTSTRRVRIFGEMVALLWKRLQYADAVKLEEIWNRYLAGRALPLLCAYPRHEFESAPREHIAGVERAHATFVA